MCEIKVGTYETWLLDRMAAGLRRKGFIGYHLTLARRSGNDDVCGWACYRYYPVIFGNLEGPGGGRGKLCWAQ